MTGLILAVVGAALLALGLAMGHFIPPAGIMLCVGIGLCVRQRGLFSKKYQLRRVERGKVRDQEKLKEMALHHPDLSMRMAAASQLTDQGALKEVMEAQPDGMVAAAALENVTDQACLADVVRQSKGSLMREKALQKIADPDLLAGLGPCVAACNDLSLSRMWLEAVCDAAKSRPELMLKVSDAARQMIHGAHEDHNVMVGGGHDDAWQRVPHVSSDCHSDHTVWTQRKGGPYGEWGYHADAQRGGTKQHQDSLPLAEWEDKLG